MIPLFAGYDIVRGFEECDTELGCHVLTHAHRNPYGETVEHVTLVGPRELHDQPPQENAP